MTRYGKNKGGFAYELVIDHEEKSITIEEYLNGKRRAIPLSKFYSDDTHYITMACRVMAYALLERADAIQYSKDFYHETDVQAQIKLMMEENEPIFG